MRLTKRPIQNPPNPFVNLPNPFDRHLLQSI